MTVREYIGARYVPLFMGAWDEEATYEPLSIVQYQGNSYTSRQFVPANTPITDTVYWAVTGNYNAQVEAYRQEVYTFDGRITDNEEAIYATQTALETETAARESADTTINNNITLINDAVSSMQSDISGLDSNLTAETAAREAADSAETAAREAADSAETAAREAADTALNEEITDLKEMIEAIETVSSNWLDNPYHTSYWGYKIPKKYFEACVSNCNGSQIYSAPQMNPMDFMRSHPNAILGHNCDFGANNGLRPCRVNGINYNVNEEPHYYPLLAFDSEAQTLQMYPSYTSVATIPSNFDYAFSISHQIIIDHVVQTNFPGWTEGHYDWSNSLAPRMALGEDDDYFYGLFCEGRGLCERGMRLQDMAQVLHDVWDVKNAYNLDGGGSVCMVTNVPFTTKINRVKDFTIKFDEMRNNSFVWYYVIKDGE